MIIVVSYYFALFATCIFLAVYGGRTGRWSGSVMLTAAVLSLASVISGVSYTHVLTSLFAIDLASLMAKIAIALVSPRRWPIWLAAFQLNAVTAHIVGMISPVLKNSFYYAMITVWAVPMLVVAVVGTILDRRWRVRNAEHPEGQAYVPLDHRNQIPPSTSSC